MLKAGVDTPIVELGKTSESDDEMLSVDKEGNDRGIE